MGAPETPSRAQPTTDAGRMRMLDELEAVVRPRAVERSSAPPNWLIALLAFGVVLGGVVWWSKHRGSDAASMAAATGIRVAAAPAPAAPPAAVLAPPAAASAPAVIETMAQVPVPAAPAEVAVAEAAGASATPPPASTAPAARPPVRTNAAPARAAAPKPDDAKVTTVTTASGGKWTLTVAAVPAAADTPLPAPASAIAVPERARDARQGDDADVRLLSALLAHVSRPAAGAALADEDQLTIAQLVKRCDSRPAVEVRECRRRICEGYWGKAEACPAAAAAAAKKG